MMRSDRATENLGHTPISGSLAREEFKSTESDTIRMPADVVGKLIVLGVVLLFSFSAPAADQEGYHGHGHGQWHAQFYSGTDAAGHQDSLLQSPRLPPNRDSLHKRSLRDQKGRAVDTVPIDKIIKVTAPYGGAHICAPSSETTPWGQDYVFCVIMP